MFYRARRDLERRACGRGPSTAWDATKGLTADPTLAIRAAVAGEPFRSGFTGYLDFQYVEDVADAFIACLLNDNQGVHVFNFAGELASIEQFVTELLRQEPRACGPDQRRRTTGTGGLSDA